MKSVEIFEQIISSRLGPKEKDIFLKPDYQRDLNNPLLMPDMKVALDRIKKAIINHERVCIYGDYDIDGISATALLYEVFIKLGLSVSCYIPNRFTEGYGINRSALEDIREEGTGLVVSVDCGTVSYDEIKFANNIGLDVIVTDHHEPGDRLPPAIAVINPKRKDSQYPFKELAGVGVAFKLAQALFHEYDIKEGLEKWLLDLVALGTVCDAVNLIGENRALVFWGLRVMRLGRRPGINALADVSSLEISSLDSSNIAFSLGPRLNAPGRMGSARLSLELLLCQDKKNAEKYVKEINSLNEARRSDQKQATQEALKKIEKTEDKVIVVFDDNWSDGIIGIVASRIVEEVKKPAFVFSINGKLAKGSARSFGDFNLALAFKQNEIAKLLSRGGGHDYAAGCTIQASQLTNFKRAINEHYEKLGIEDQDQKNFLRPVADIEINSVEGLDMDLVSFLEILSPFGQGNPFPIIKINGLYMESLNFMGSKDHCRIISRDKRGEKSEMICFGVAQKINKRLKQNPVFSAWVEVDKNTYRGETKVQVKIVDLE